MYRFEYAQRKHGRNFKITCPACGQKHKYNLFFDNENNCFAPEEFGKCDRINHCGYEHRPEGQKVLNPNTLHHEIQPMSVFDKGVVKEYAKTVFKDPLSLYLIKKFGARGKQVLRDYIVTSKYIEDWLTYAPVFWYIDDNNEVRSGKVMNYEVSEGYPKRTKYKQTCFNFKWLHTNIEDYNYAQIVFGAHLVTKYPEKEIHIVESEKTALIMACVKPEYIWLATLAFTGLQEEFLPDLKGRKIVAHPDKGEKTFNYWTERIKEFLDKNLVLSGEVSTFTEENDLLEEGDDVADYVILKL